MLELLNPLIEGIKLAKSNPLSFSLKILLHPTGYNLCFDRSWCQVEKFF